MFCIKRMNSRFIRSRYICIVMINIRRLKLKKQNVESIQTKPIYILNVYWLCREIEFWLDTHTRGYIRESPFLETDCNSLELVPAIELVPVSHTYLVRAQAVFDAGDIARHYVEVKSDVRRYSHSAAPVFSIIVQTVHLQRIDEHVGCWLTVAKERSEPQFAGQSENSDRIWMILLYCE